MSNGQNPLTSGARFGSVARMTDEKTGTSSETPVPVTKPASASPEPQVMGLPLGMFIKGGTTTIAHDNAVAEYKLDVARRRAVADQERAAAQRPVEEGGAIVHTNKLTDSPDANVAHVLLKYLTPQGEQKYANGNEFQCLGDIVMVSETELALILVCPGCMERGMPMDLCQIKINQSNRKWELDTRKAGELIMFDDHPYRSAGEIMDCERFSCSQCGWAARIDKNRVWTQ
jgi:hypothetical protein